MKTLARVTPSSALKMQMSAWPGNSLMAREHWPLTAKDLGLGRRPGMEAGTERA